MYIHMYIYMCTRAHIVYHINMQSI